MIAKADGLVMAPEPKKHGGRRSRKGMSGGVYTPEKPKRKPKRKKGDVGWLCICCRTEAKLLDWNEWVYQYVCDNLDCMLYRNPLKAILKHPAEPEAIGGIL